ncbi:hypothetical protein [Polynucleobacter arcticus]|uniref:Uncharacterized protein n=1 Tax=Polynucleobacter arcticus TaxID=1743165 RepID=A0A6M9PB31_9BURK|nr:hypothetical protein [Polynucleobacter arcticus]QKM59880.1 hypothetical protein DN92_01845 [Polynucleobacter arcticus]
MRRTFLHLLIGFLWLLSSSVFAQSSPQTSQKAQMRYVGTFEAGQPGAGIYKLYDASDDVVCYVLMPDTASRKQVDSKWVYEGNALGSISCLKANSTNSANSAISPVVRK